ncbi:1-pyrroline-5-carboxylate dehydrogenase [Paraburkholderia caledonica]|uniref:L-glutamate gamma-semialdehyde dehydrogenase n=2 Tax=Paraburkholderia caledonica TaxID=134536 RepID=A0AB73IMM7_9BURK|nr:1-pyrroline-5-carboxylate dehydrogenase [Paraburkholderia caledonica]
MSTTQIEIPAIVAGTEVRSDDTATLTAPHNHDLALAKVHRSSRDTVEQAITAAVEAQRDWADWTFEERATVFLRAADLLAGPWRQTLNAATMLGQSKTVYQAEIDSACELIDFLRFNVAFAKQIIESQPLSSPGVSNQLDYRSLEGFVYAVTPFNFTAIGGNLACAPALMGNSVVWKPAASAALSNYLFLQLLHEAGLPRGVINFVPGEAGAVSSAVVGSPHFAGLHFTGSTAVFDSLWNQISERLPEYASYPRLVGETGGKDFVLAHASADIDSLAVALLRGAFEYQGQKCSAASRAYIPKSIWPQVRERLLDDLSRVKMGDVTDFQNFIGAVIDRKAFNRIRGFIERANESTTAKVIAGGKTDDSRGFFVTPTVLLEENPHSELMQDEIFGPVLTVHVYEDGRWEDILRLVDQTSSYALTGAVFGQDRKALQVAQKALRHAAGNFYINDKPTGAVVGQQPFGGARRSGTNDKAGSYLNLLRWTSPRTIKETSIPPTSFEYPYMK